ncbi:hypothetical protein M413DRAFT_124327 [Hebeloma cylindrosporum]|uniref:Peptidase A1 domain-containing protein n=1 Tax=Hebeloma cylindrosporum TaxID=76867 RepID=A0A0C3CF51_HEBCY|nr:hypothetical protein M413DRAFT_124327 [Hebeloma cylindrosporum h7]
MGPRDFCTLSVLCLLFMTVGALGSPTTNHTNGVFIARFSRKGTPVRSVGGLSDTERYARALTRRKPTRRGTAKRQAPSEFPPTPQTAFVGAVTTDETPLPVGNLLVSEYGTWTVTSDPGSAVTYFASPSWISLEQQRLSLDPETSMFYPLFGASQCSPGGGMDLRPGSSDIVCLASIENPGTPPGSTPMFIPNSIGPGGGGQDQTATETDIWTINYTTGQATPQWVNPDGTSFPSYMIYDPLTGEIYITGDIMAATNRFQRAFAPVVSPLPQLS